MQLPASATLLRIAIATLILIVALPTTAPMKTLLSSAQAQSLQQREQQKKRNEAELKRIENEQVQTRGELAELETQKRTISITISQGEKRIASLSEQIDALTVTYQERQAELFALHDNLDVYLTNIFLFDDQWETVLFSYPDKPENTLLAAILIESIAPELSKQSVAIATHLTEMETTRTALEERRQKIQQEKALYQERIAKVEVLFNEINNKNIDLKAERTEISTALKSLDQLIRVLKRRNANATKKFPSVIFPPSYGKPSYDRRGNAVVIRTRKLAPVFAPHAGKVEYADRTAGGSAKASFTVVIGHSAQYYSVLSGMDALYTTLNSQLLAEDLIAKMVSSTELRYKIFRAKNENITWLDPRKYLPIKSIPATAN